MVSNLALFFGNLFGYFSKNWVIFSKSSGHPGTEQWHNCFLQSVQVLHASAQSIYLSCLCYQFLLLDLGLKSERFTILQLTASIQTCIYSTAGYVTNMPRH